MLNIPVEVDIASEFRYRNPLVDENSLVIIISQSGETADTLAALRLVNEKGAKVISIVNAVGSSIARESGVVLYTLSGPEIAVASTKAFTSQLMVIYILMINLALKLNKINEGYAKELVVELNNVPNKIKEILDKSNDINEIAELYKNTESVYYIGRSLNYTIALEGSLKLKEISYIHSEGFAAGELKHGPISLITEDTLIIGIVTIDNLKQKIMSNVKEVTSRGAKSLIITNDKNIESDHKIIISNINYMFSSILSVIPLQLYSYYVALYRGCDIDKPRNLAKSVTVE